MNKTLRINYPHLKVENKAAAGAGAIFTGRHLQNITAVFRAVELLLFLAVISRFSVALPLAFRLSGDYFRDLAVTLASPRFVFVVGNAIVITLFLKSGKLSGAATPPAVQAAVAPPPEATTTFIVSVYSAPPKSSPAGKNPVTAAAAEVKINCYRRSKSEKVYVKPAEKGVVERKGAGELRRTKTERVERRLGMRCQGQYPEDGLSSEEFRRTIEDFIARQQRFLREEEDETLALAG